MSKNDYLGEELVTDLTGTDYEGFTPTQWALEYIFRYGQIDGDHHKTWVLDQVARILCGTPVIVKKASWGTNSANVRLVEYRHDTAEEPSVKYEAWVASQTPGEKTRALREFAFTSLVELAALEFIAAHGVHEQPNVYTKSKDEHHAVCMRLHALGQHKLWMLDQVARILHGAPEVTSMKPIKAVTPTAEYLEWVKERKGEEDENGETECGYEEGEPLPESKRGAPAPYCAGIAP